MKGRNRKLLDAAGLYAYAVRALSARAMTQGELRERLAARAAQKKDPDGVIFRLKQHGYLNDQRFAETYSRLRKENEGYGKFRVLRDLRARRVAPELAEKAVAEAYKNADERAMIRSFLERRLRFSGASPAIGDPRRLASAYRMLLRAGFSSGKILESLRALSAEPDWADGLETAANEEAPD